MPNPADAPRESVRTEWLRIRERDGVSAGYDYLADQFERATGKLAPGKDVPAAMGGGDWQATMEEFHQWRKANGCYLAIPQPRHPVPEEG